MYEYLKGTLAEITPLHAIVEVNGVGYKLQIPIHLFGKEEAGKKVTFYTSLVVRENFQGLYGFLEKEERNLFELLITLSGVGPKTALSLIGHLPMRDFQSAIYREDSARLSKVPGIGKKTAERLIVDLKGKFAKTEHIEERSHSLQKIDDAISALIQLGYQANAAQTAVQKVLEKSQEELDTSRLIAAVLKARL